MSEHYPKYKMLDLFCGAGGLSSGLEQAGFHPLLAMDIEQTYTTTYALNHPNTKVLTQDICNVDASFLFETVGLNLGELDLLVGGPPCQGFSVNAPVRSLDDQRNHLFKDFLRIVSAFLPKVVLIENVPGIVSINKGTVVSDIYEELYSLGYNVEHKILFAGHYGIPQLRFRTVFLAYRDCKKVLFPTPTHYATAIANFSGAKELCQRLLQSQSLLPQVNVSQAISDLPPLYPGEKIDSEPYPLPCHSEYQKELRKHSSFIYNHACSRLGKVNLERIKYVPQGGSWRDIPFDLLPSGLKRARRSDHTKRYGRLHPDGLCSTILTKCDPHWGSFIHPSQDRALSVREAARMQSFPDNYRFFGTLTQQFMQVGNAVPPILAKAIGMQIVRGLSGASL